MMTGPDSRNRSYSFGNRYKQSADGKTKWVPDGDGSPSSANLEAANSNRSLGTRRNSTSPVPRNSKGPVPRNSKSPAPGKRMMSSKVLPLAMSPTLDDQKDESIENLCILRSGMSESYPCCSQLDNKQYSVCPMPLRTVSAEELEIVTNNFTFDDSIAIRDEILFKGNLDGHPVLVSRKVSDEKKKFFSEVDILRRLQHPNVISLRAFCKDDNNQALAFNFVCNRFLSWHLSFKNLREKLALQWPKRATLSIELAKGLLYLHDSCSIIHGNINSTNVFVTQDFVPVIGNFSLARRSAVMHEILQDRSTDKEARGYLAPEYKTGGESSEKQDIYAFGVILIELISGRAAFDRKHDIKFLDEWGRRTIEDLKLDFILLVETMIDPRLSKKFEFKSVLDMIQVAKLCLTEDPTKRPPIRVVRVLLSFKNLVEMHT